MKDSTDLINKRSVNYAFKDNIVSLIESIKLAYEALENSQINLSESYVINDEIGDRRKLKEIIDILKEKYNILKTITLPAIDSDISGISVSIETSSINNDINSNNIE